MAQPDSFWTDRTIFRHDRPDPYLHLHVILVFVRDQERSLRFYADQLGFTTVVDFRFESGERWIEVAPPDGTAKLSLVLATPGSGDEALIGRFTGIFFLTEDVEAKFHEWVARGVEFESQPQQPLWGAMVTRFHDIDGNSFGLAGYDEATTALETKRRTLAARAEGERRYRQEIEIAKQIQARLLPQRIPTCPSIDCAGICIQARQVGGDYYDFLDLGQHRLCIAIADISGKGIGAALLMAHLQATLRSHSAIASHSPERLLRTLNQLFYENTAESSYATLFFAHYDDETHQLTYVNCGHLPGLVLRQDGSLTRLDSTATVLGLFEKWDCSAQCSRLLPGDVLVIYTDGVTEALNAAGEEFGEDRLAQVVRENSHGSADEILRSLVDTVRSFSATEQSDDITAIVAKCKDQ